MQDYITTYTQAYMQTYITTFKSLPNLNNSLQTTQIQ